MKNIISKQLIILSLLITLTAYSSKIFSCTVPTNLTLNYTFTTSVAGESVEVTWTSDCPSAMMEITLVNIPLWTGQQFYANIPNTGSYFFAINPNIILGETLFVIKDMGTNIWHYGPQFELTAPLPVELSAFHSYLMAFEKEVEISFQTDSESNVSHFDIQHSLDGRNFRDIGKIQAYGTTSTPQPYRFIHHSPAYGYNYYRIKINDLDRFFEYSDIESVFRKAIDPIEVFPNPSHGIFHIRGEISRAENIMVFDNSGKTVAKYSTDESSIDISTLPEGYYLIVLHFDNQSIIRRIIKQD